MDNRAGAGAGSGPEPASWLAGAGSGPKWNGSTTLLSTLGGFFIIYSTGVSGCWYSNLWHRLRSVVCHQNFDTGIHIFKMFFFICAGCGSHGGRGMDRFEFLRLPEQEDLVVFETSSVRRFGPFWDLQSKKNCMFKGLSNRIWSFLRPPSKKMSFLDPQSKKIC